jgi:hypothetical protein
VLGILETISLLLLWATFSEWIVLNMGIVYSTREEIVIWLICITEALGTPLVTSEARKISIVDCDMTDLNAPLLKT